MALYFFDSSALAKFYHPEVGTPTVEQIVQDGGNQVRLSRLAVVEMTSVFAIKVRTGFIQPEDARVFLRQFREDIALGRLEVFSIRDAEFAVAERLVEKYAFDLRFRALDALQLAAAISLKSRAPVDYFVAADKILCEVAALEGFSVMNQKRDQRSSVTSNL